MGEERFLIVRLSSMGDILNTLPAYSALRAGFPSARIEWLVDEKWRPLVEQVQGLNGVIAVRQSSWGALREAIAELRRRRYSCAIDPQGLYKSALLPWLARVPRRIGFDRNTAREPGATIFYTDRVATSAVHVVDQYLALSEHLGGRLPGRDVRSLFPLRDQPEVEAGVAQLLAAAGIGDYFVLSPGGGWTSKCWPAERYGELHRRVAKRFGWRGVVSFGPGERPLAETVLGAADEPAPLLIEMDVPALIAALRRARFFIGGDSGPLHLAVAVGTSVIGLYGPTDPLRNGPYSAADIAIRNAGPEETTHRRGSKISHTMLSISVEQAEEAIVRRLELKA